jgi:hypothetical protein
MLRYRTSPNLFRHKSRDKTCPVRHTAPQCSVTSQDTGLALSGTPLHNVPSQVKTQDLPCQAHRTHSAKSRTVLTTAQKSPSVQLPRTVVQPRHPQPSEIHNPSEYIILVRLRRGGGWEERLTALLPTAPHGLMSRTWHSDNFPIFWLLSERRDSEQNGLHVYRMRNLWQKVTVLARSFTMKTLKVTHLGLADTTSLHFNDDTHLQFILQTSTYFEENQTSLRSYTCSELLCSCISKHLPTTHVATCYVAVYQDISQQHM